MHRSEGADGTGPYKRHLAGGLPHLPHRCRFLALTTSYGKDTGADREGSQHDTVVIDVVVHCQGQSCTTATSFTPR